MRSFFTQGSNLNGTAVQLGLSPAMLRRALLATSVCKLVEIKLNADFEDDPRLRPSRLSILTTEVKNALPDEDSFGREIAFTFLTGSQFSENPSIYDTILGAEIIEVLCDGTTNVAFQNARKKLAMEVIVLLNGRCYYASSDDAADDAQDGIAAWLASNFDYIFVGPSEVTKIDIASAGDYQWQPSGKQITVDLDRLMELLEQLLPTYGDKMTRGLLYGNGNGNGNDQTARPTATPRLPRTDSRRPASSRRESATAGV